MQLVVAAVVVDRLDAPTQVLAARRTGPPELAGQWELPGGKVEPGEEPVDALHRELAEELGIGVRRGAELLPEDGGTWPLTPGLEMRVWWCAVDDGRPQPGEAHDELRWLAADQLFAVPWLAPDRPLLAQLGALLARPGGSADPSA